MTLASTPVVQTQLCIRRPVAEVFEALVDPAITTRFWFTKSSGRVESGARLVWEWEMYGARADVTVLAVDPCERIAIEWGDPPTPVEWRFEARRDGSTLVAVTATGFQGSDEQVVAAALDSMGGFSLLLAGWKAWLEHGIALDLVGDRHPDAHVG